MPALRKGTHEGRPYKAHKMFAKVTGIYGIAMQRRPVSPS